jgi:hypothetical protein
VPPKAFYDPALAAAFCLMPEERPVAKAGTSDFGTTEVMP